MKKFYVYEYWDVNKNEPFYVGKGSGKRYSFHLTEAKQDNKEGNMHKKNRISKLLKEDHKIDIRFVFETNKEQDAYDEETRLIQLYGRRDLGTGPLTNLNNGGKGSSSPSPEIRIKIGGAMRGKKHTKETIEKIRKAGIGVTHSKKTKEKMSNSAKGRKFSKETIEKMRKAKEGYVPWNKGKKTGLVTSGAFKKGRIPWNKKNKNNGEIL